MNQHASRVLCSFAFVCLLVCPFVAGADATDLNTVTISQSWCDDGTFRFTINVREWPTVGPDSNCVALAGAGLIARPKTLEKLNLTLEGFQRNVRVLEPLGTLEQHVLKDIYHWRAPFTEYPLPLPREYEVMEGQCGNRWPIFVVRSTGMDHVHPSSASRAADQCKFQESTVKVSSMFEIAGVYERPNGATLDAFIQLLKGLKWGAVVDMSVLNPSY